MWEALISGGLSLLSGFGARQSAQKQQKLQMAFEYQNRINNLNTSKEILEKYDFKLIPTHAAAAGFNPVTYLGALGGSYGAMHQLAYSMQTSNMQAPTAQVPSMLEVVGTGLQSGFKTYLEGSRIAQAQEFQRSQLQTQLSAIQRNGGRPLQLPSAVPARNTTFFGSGSIPYSVSAGATVGGRVGGLIDVKPHEVTAVDPTQPYAEPGRMPEVGFLNTFGGGLAPAQSKDAKDRFEEDIAGTIGWNIRNRVMPSLGFESHGNLPVAGWGWQWEFSPFLQEYRRKYKGDTDYRDGGWNYRVPEKNWATGGSF